MIIKFKHRELLAIALLLLAIFFAGWSAIPDPPRDDNQEEISTDTEVTETDDNTLVIIDNIEWLHVAIHTIIFGSVAFLVGPWGAEGERGSIKRALVYVIVGTIVWETVQATVYTAINGLENTDFDWPWFSRVLTDLFVNTLSASIVLFVISIFQRNRE